MTPRSVGVRHGSPSRADIREDDHTEWQIGAQDAVNGIGNPSRDNLSPFVSQRRWSGHIVMVSMYSH